MNLAHPKAYVAGLMHILEIKVNSGDKGKTHISKEPQASGEVRLGVFYDAACVLFQLCGSSWSIFLIG